jgi:hypothetical protein
MTFVSLILFILIGIGITNIVVNASILDRIRDMLTSQSEFLEGLLGCMLCSGFWIGALLSFGYESIGIIAGGAVISLTSYAFGSLMEYVHASTNVKEAQIEYIDVEEE